MKRCFLSLYVDLLPVLKYFIAVDLFFVFEEVLLVRESGGAVAWPDHRHVHGSTAGPDGKKKEAKMRGNGRNPTLHQPGKRVYMLHLRDIPPSGR